MASIFSKLFSRFGDRATSPLQDPIQQAEQAINDLKHNLQEALQGLTQVKSVALRLKKDFDDRERLAADYERKAMLALQQMKDGKLDSVQAERLAAQALAQKETVLSQVGQSRTDWETQQRVVDSMQGKVDQLKREITRYENDLVTLRARARTADSMQKVNKQLAGVDASSTVEMLERMKARVEEKEALAAAYGELSADEAAWADDSKPASMLPEGAPPTNDSLAALKAKMGIES